MPKFIELHAFWILSTVAFIISRHFCWNFPLTAGIKEAVLSASLSWAALTAGFFATILATILSGGGSQILMKLARAKKTNRLWYLLYFGILFSIIFAALNVLLYFVNTSKHTMLFNLWVSILVATLILFVMIACILVHFLQAMYVVPKDQPKTKILIEVPSLDGDE